MCKSVTREVIRSGEWDSPSDEKEENSESLRSGGRGDEEGEIGSGAWGGEEEDRGIDRQRVYGKG
jgi:hypothetical protein